MGARAAARLGPAALVLTAAGCGSLADHTDALAGVGAWSPAGSLPAGECVQDADCAASGPCRYARCRDGRCVEGESARGFPCGWHEVWACDGQGSCVECLADTFCPPGQICAEGACRFPCGDGLCSDGERAAECSEDCGVVDLAVGGMHSCVALASGAVRCWGDNSHGQLGGLASYPDDAAVSVPGLPAATAVACGDWHSCALHSGQVWCWGANYFGQLGDGSGYETSWPVPVLGIYDAVAVAAGTGVGGAVMSDGTARVWGDGWTGYGYSYVPAAVPGLTAVTALALGNKHRCALSQDGLVRCWGYNDRWQLGIVDASYSYQPVLVPGVADAVAIAAGANHSCVARKDGLVVCWGDNLYGQVSPLLPARCEATTIDAVAGAVGVAAGRAHSCALLGDGTLGCWGTGEAGQLGTGQHEPVPLPPTLVPAITQALAATAGGDVSAVRLADRTVRLWGDNWYGQVGVPGGGYVLGPASPDGV